MKDSTEDIIGLSILGGLLVAVVHFYSIGIQDMNTKSNGMLEDIYFNSCVKENNIIEVRRACGRYAEAVMNNYADFQAFDKTLTYDKYAHQYIVKEDVK